MKVLLVQLDSAARSNLRAIVRELTDDVDVLEAADATTTTSHIRNHPDCDLLVADLHTARSIELMRNKDDALANPAARLVVWSGSPCYLELVSAAVLGAMAYLPNTAPPSVTRAALQMVMAGGRYFPPDLLVGPQFNDWESHPSVRPALTPRQAEVLTLMAAGRSNKGIARELGMAAGTVKVHVTAILKALDVRNRTEAVVAAQRGRSPRQLHEPSRRMMSER
jgi:DNA-binding NarL/FixJ family response regulator